MSIGTTTRKAGPFIGNDAASTFAFAFKVFATSDLLVVTAAIDTGAETVLALDSDYSATLNGDQDNNPGGSITLLAGALATGLKLVIATGTAELQATAVTNQSGFYPDVYNDSLDLQTMLVQQLRETVGRALTFPLTDASSPALPAAPVRAGKMLGFDLNGNLALITVAPGGTVPGAQAAVGAVDSANRDFTFVAASAFAPAPIVFAGGVFQTPGVDYGPPLFVAGSSWKITFTVAPVNAPITVLLLA